MEAKHLISLGVSQSLANTYAPILNAVMHKFGITTQLRQQHFLAQLLHESGRFKYTKELASGQAYEGRKDLGNTNPGDGVKFKGRGLIQLTGRANYTAFYKDTGLDVVNHPEILEQPENAALVAGWFWNRRNLNILADRDDLLAITKKINGGTNGLQKRKEFLEKLKNLI